MGAGAAGAYAPARGRRIGGRIPDSAAGPGDATDPPPYTLAEEAGAAPTDPVPALIAGRLAGIRQVVLRDIGRRSAAGAGVDAAAAHGVAQLDAVESLLGAEVLGHAVRGGIDPVGAGVCGRCGRGGAWHRPRRWPGSAMICVGGAVGSADGSAGS
ncbi:hypothetical protein [Embleya sp. AB8]|uniref:hypothetical protein n=1 Tax=Embleya sp. AB8 TaxID=3156304 RepID=UPI003C7648C2